MSVIVSARWSLKALRRLLLRRLTQKRGSHQPASRRDEPGERVVEAGQDRARRATKTTRGAPMTAAGADGQVLRRAELQVGASQLARQVGTPVAPLDDAIDADGGRGPEEPGSACVRRLAASAGLSRACDGRDGDLLDALDRGRRDGRRRRRRRAGRPRRRRGGRR